MTRVEDVRAIFDFFVKQSGAEIVVQTVRQYVPDCINTHVFKVHTIDVDNSIIFVNRIYTTC